MSIYALKDLIDDVDVIVFRVRALMKEILELELPLTRAFPFAYHVTARESARPPKLLSKGSTPG